MSRIAATYLNTPLAQLERLETVRSVFERNTRAQIDNALGFVIPSEDVLRLAKEVKAAAAAVVLAHVNEPEMDVASRNFVSLVKQLQFALLQCGQLQGSSKYREISSLGV